MTDVNAVKIPIYNYSDPALWFYMCESTFELGIPKAITDSKTKYNYIVANIPPEAASTVRDVITKPDATDPYQHIKTELIKRSGESSQREIRKLLTGEQLGDRKPSELLRGMQRRAEAHKVPDELMLELFLQQLPTSVQSILAAISPMTIEKAAEVADRVMEVTPMQVSAFSVTSVDSIENRLLEEIKKLNLRVDELSRGTGRDRSRGNSARRSRSKSQTKKFDTCWYHYKFGENAQKCTPPCKFSKNAHGPV